MSTNKRHALLVGIEYLGTPNAIPGCHRDVDHIHTLLQQNLGYQSSNITVVTEKSGIMPTRRNILQQLDQLVNTCISTEGEQCFIYFSCHGNQIRDRNGDESSTDRMDEVLVPLDYNRAGYITDDVLVTYLSRFPHSCPCIAVFDSCNSGSMADLPYSFNYDPSNGTCTSRIQNQLRLNSTVVSISGCKDYQVSDLVLENGQWDSAMTTALIGILRETREAITFFQLQKRLIDYMIAQQLPQRPVVSTSWKARPGLPILTIPPSTMVKPNTVEQIELPLLQQHLLSEPSVRQQLGPVDPQLWQLAFSSIF